ncbi:MAG: response regulator transcription factor [Lachnospiraceae bacterium]|nr:response regulator transcription factor [Lachnospiraceae bacterium]
MKEFILIVEDDNDINCMLKELLEGQGYETVQAFSGTEALLYLEKRVPDGVILDLMLPGMAGEELLKHIKEKSPDTAVVVSSAKEDVQVRISLLKAGADDYVVKPFDTQELLARLEAVLRRLGRIKQLQTEEEKKAQNGAQESSVQCGKAQSGNAQEGRVIKYKDIVMRPEDFFITVGGEAVSLTKREYLILELLMENPAKVFTKSNIYESVWNEEFLGEDNAVNVHISNIRQKLAKVNPEETYIQTVWGIGFKMN